MVEKKENTLNYDVTKNGGVQRKENKKQKVNA